MGQMVPVVDCVLRNCYSLYNYMRSPSGIWGETSNRYSFTMPCKVVIIFNIHITEALSTGIHISCPPGGSLLFSLCIGRSKAPHSCITKMDLFNNNINSTNNKNQSNSEGYEMCLVKIL